MTDEEAQALQNELETTRTELEGIKTEKETLAGEKETLTAELEAKAAAVATLEQTAGEKEAELTTLKQGAAESGDVLSNVNTSLANAVSAYKTIVAQANPSVPVELITGDTIEAINQSLESANTIVTKVREAVKEEISSASIPAGAPARTPPDLSALSPREKIQYAITKGGKA